jgi:hypothetical protein
LFVIFFGGLSKESFHFTEYRPKQKKLTSVSLAHVDVVDVAVAGRVVPLGVVAQDLDTLLGVGVVGLVRFPKADAVVGSAVRPDVRAFKK